MIMINKGVECLWVSVCYLGAAGVKKKASIHRASSSGPIMARLGVSVACGIASLLQLCSLSAFGQNIFVSMHKILDAQFI